MSSIPSEAWITLAFWQLWAQQENHQLFAYWVSLIFIIILLFITMMDMNCLTEMWLHDEVLTKKTFNVQ